MVAAAEDEAAGIAGHPQFRIGDVLCHLLGILAKTHRVGLVVDPCPEDIGTYGPQTALGENLDIHARWVGGADAGHKTAKSQQRRPQSHRLKQCNSPLNKSIAT